MELGSKTRASAIYSGVDERSRRAVVHDGVEQYTPSTDKRSADEASKLIGMVGRITPWKGQHVFLKAAALVRRRYPKTRFQIIGAALFNEKAYEQEIIELRDKLNLKDAVEFLGFRNDVSSLIEKMDLVVHASTTGEPFGQVVIEAMVASKPVVATDGGGIPEIVRDGTTGLLVPMGDHQAMSEAICRILADPTLAWQMGEAARVRVSQSFTIERTVQQLQTIFDRLVSRPAGAQVD